MKLPRAKPSTILIAITFSLACGRSNSLRPEFTANAKYAVLTIESGSSGAGDAVNRAIAAAQNPAEKALASAIEVLFKDSTAPDAILSEVGDESRNIATISARVPKLALSRLARIMRFTKDPQLESHINRTYEERDACREEISAALDAGKVTRPLASCSGQRLSELGRFVENWKIDDDRAHPELYQAGAPHSKH
jgi:hypothetical protein